MNVNNRGFSSDEQGTSSSGRYFFRERKKNSEASEQSSNVASLPPMPKGRRVQNKRTQDNKNQVTQKKQKYGQKPAVELNVPEKSIKEFQDLQKRLELQQEELKQCKKLNMVFQKSLQRLNNTMQRNEEQKEALCEHRETLYKNLEEQRKLLQEHENILKSSLACMNISHPSLQTELRNEMDKLLLKLTCVICTDIFVKATTLNCGHTFCSNCILKWRETKNQCPICRSRIPYLTKCIAIDDCIDEIFEKLSPEVQEKRQQLIREHAENRVLEGPSVVSDIPPMRPLRREMTNLVVEVENESRSSTVGVQLTDFLPGLSEIFELMLTADPEL